MEDTDIKTAMEMRVMAEMVMEPARVTGGMENTKETIIEREMEKADGGMTKAAETETDLMDSKGIDCIALRNMDWKQMTSHGLTL